MSSPQPPEVFGPRKVGPKGQVSLPVEVQEPLGMSPGAEVFLVVDARRVIVITKKEFQARFRWP